MRATKRHLLLSMVIGVHCYPRNSDNSRTTNLVSPIPTKTNGEKHRAIPSRKHRLQFAWFPLRANQTSCCRHTVAPSRSVLFHSVGQFFMIFREVSYTAAVHSRLPCIVAGPTRDLFLLFFSFLPIRVYRHSRPCKAHSQQPINC